MSKEAMKLALEALEQYTNVVASVNNPDAWVTVVDAGKPAREAIAALREALAEQKSGIKQVIELYDSPDQPSQQEPVAFPARKAVEREIERTANPTGMHLNDGKERVALPGGTLRHMLALIDRTPPPAQRTWVGLTEKDKEHLSDLSADPRWNAWIGMEQTEAKLRSKNGY